MLVGHLNLAACHLRLNNNFKCMKECEKVGCPEIHNLMRCRQGKRGFLELSLSIYASWFRCWIDSIQTQICFQLSLLSAWKQIVIFGRKREATREFFRQEETTAGNMFVFAGYHHGRWLSHYVRVLHFTRKVCFSSLLVFYSTMRGSFPSYYSLFYFFSQQKPTLWDLRCYYEFFLWLLVVVLLFLFRNWLKTKLGTWLKTNNFPKQKENYIKWMLPD